MSRLDTLAEGPSRLPSSQNRQLRSSIPTDNQFAMSPPLSTSHSSRIPIRSGQSIILEPRYQWPSSNHSPETRTPFATKKAHRHKDTRTGQSSTRSEKHSYNRDQDTPLPSDSKKSSKRKRSLSNNTKSKIKKPRRNSPTTSASKLKALAESLADDTPLGQIMEKTFLEHDMRMIQQGHNLARTSIAVSMSGSWQMKEVDDSKDVDSMDGDCGSSFDEDAARVWNICARRVMVAVEKERSLRRGRDSRRGVCGGVEVVSPKFVVWKD